MSELARALAAVRKKIALHQGKGISEQGTKQALIEPVLRALGWEIGLLEEVCPEFKCKPQDKPVDYALFVFRTLKLLIEAKALDENLDDWRWAKQIMGYAAVAGAKWIIITNGNEYRLYNACADVPAEQKLFRSVRLTDDGPLAATTLALLTKDRLTDLDDIWNAFFVDSRVRAVLECLFSHKPDSSLVQLVDERIGKILTKKLPTEDIRASLARVRAHFDFPIESHSSTGTAAESSEISLKVLIAAGVLKAPVQVVRRYKQHVLKAKILADGRLVFQGKPYDKCSAAAVAAKHSVSGKNLATNGWDFWQYADGNGKLVPLTAAKQAFLTKKAT